MHREPIESIGLGLEEIPHVQSAGLLMMGFQFIPNGRFRDVALMRRSIVSHVVSLAMVPPRFREVSFGSLFPESKTTGESVGILSEFTILGQFLPIELLCIATADHDVVGFERSFEFGDDLQNRQFPFLLSQVGIPPLAGEILERLALLVWKMACFHGLQLAIDDHGCTQPVPRP